jgi:hypothetical protein
MIGSTFHTYLRVMLVLSTIGLPPLETVSIIPILLRWSPIRRLYAVGRPTFGIHYGFDERRHFTQNLVLAGYSDTFTSSGEPFAHRVSTGIAFGVGFDAGARWLHVKPEVRWSHWIAPAFDSYLYLTPTTNEVEVLVGFEFGGGR